MTCRAAYSILGALTLLLLGKSEAAEFVRPEKPGDPLIYGVKDGILLAVHPFALDSRRNGGPRGLVRVGYEEAGERYLINYIAVEPVVGDDQGLSELEDGGDGRPGKRFRVGDRLADGSAGKTGNVFGRIEETDAGRVLTIVLHVESFENGAEPVVEARFYEETPHRVRFRTFSAPGGARMRRCVLTATMGNQSRCRTLWLGSGSVFAPALYEGYRGTGFVEKDAYPVADLHRLTNGDVACAISPDEPDPSKIRPLPNGVWRHDGKWMAQFWLKPAGSYDESLRCRVNGRHVYWNSDIPIPGGIAFENFEFREDFRPGQEIWFGYTDESPARAFGFPYDASPPDAPGQRKRLEAATPGAVGSDR